MECASELKAPAEGRGGRGVAGTACEEELKGNQGRIDRELC